VVVGAIAVLVALFLVVRLLSGRGAVNVAVAPAVRVSVTGEPLDGSRALTAAGYIVADKQSVLAYKFTGRLAKLNVAESQPVKKGDILAELDHSELDATIKQAEAGVDEAAAEVQRLSRMAAQADAEVVAAKSSLQTFDAENEQYRVLRDDAQRRLDLNTRLLPSRAVTSSEVDDRKAEVSGMKKKMEWTRQRKREAEYRIAAAEAQAAAALAAVPAAEARHRSAVAHVEVLKSQLKECSISSPFDGVVTEKAAEVGEIIAPISIGGSMARGSVVTVVDRSSLQAEVDVAETRAAEIKDNQPAEITVDAVHDVKYTGKVHRIVPRADRSKATVKVRVAFSPTIEEDKRILPEMGVRVRFLPETSPQDHAAGAARIVVPKSAVRAGQGGNFVWVVREDTAHKHSVELGATLGEQVEVIGEVKAGDKVVVRGAEDLTGESAKVRLSAE
jgi:RND family efflux transporter MFP subunit